MKNLLQFEYPVYKPSLTGKKKRYVNEKFEQSFAEYIGIKYAMCVCGVTVAIHLVLAALGIGEDDEVIVPALPYIASVNQITQMGESSFVNKLMSVMV